MQIAAAPFADYVDKTACEITVSDGGDAADDINILDVLRADFTHVCPEIDITAPVVAVSRRGLKVGIVVKRPAVHHETGSQGGSRIVAVSQSIRGSQIDKLRSAK